MDMCGRFANRFEANELSTVFKTAIPLSNSRQLPAYNITPGTSVPIIRAKEGKRIGEYMNWGLPSPVKKASRSLLINARAETMIEKPTFRDAAHRHRCVVLASGWYEWKAPKQPYYISRLDGAPMAFAGLYWEGETPNIVIITTAADNELVDIHHRAPLQIPVDASDNLVSLNAWLDPYLPQDQIMSMTKPSPSEPLSWHPAPPEVGRNTIDHDGLLKAYDEVENNLQPSLF